VELMSAQGPWLPPAMLSTLLQAQLLLPVRWSLPELWSLLALWSMLLRGCSFWA
jgi:hypothetical protein